MTSLRPALGQLRTLSQVPRPQWQQLRQRLQALQLGAGPASRRKASTETTTPNAPEGVLIPAAGPSSFFDPAVVLAPHARPLPVSPSYFTRQANFMDSYIELRALDRKYGHLPTAPADQIQRVAWKTLRDYQQDLGEKVKATDYRRCMNIVKRLHRIHPRLVPPAVKTAVQGFMRTLNPYSNVPKPTPIDTFGRALGVGRRKTSTARAWVVEGTGEVLINGKSLADAFGRVHDRESAVWALRCTERMDKYNVWALVDGGGTTGQAEALTLAVAKALLAHEPALKTTLRRAGCITRDPRRVERKKHGHLKARKKPAWVKR
ncbi:hypothetical protein NKR23_g7047 [Pleurostoma richardsiae]|uniref:Small ribosomal subunit protein uS9m n=1 Tax=Pleurostoma richardsiae TaxID=41990 RepID=A0AA38VHA2_9PEZI|nr:hypothetical protein NKR23_g7047 [Pleurostoma richardsiae]